MSNPASVLYSFAQALCDDDSRTVFQASLWLDVRAWVSGIGNVPRDAESCMAFTRIYIYIIHFFRRDDR